MGEAGVTMSVIDVNKETKVYRKIAAELRSDIERQLQAGDTLPPERDLAERFSVHRLTIRQALEVLADEGLISRLHGRGTVVLDRNGTGEIAIVAKASLLSPSGSPYYQVVSHALLEVMKARNPKWSLRIHVGTGDQNDESLLQSLDLQEPDVMKRLRGVFTFHPLQELETALLAQHVPMVMLAGFMDAEVVQGKGVRHCVWFDMRTLYDRGIALLQKAGCRSVGAIWQCEPNGSWLQHPLYRMLQKSGLEFRPEWVAPFTGGLYEQAGYEAMIRLWRQPHHPDGILVHDDIACRGVLRAALHLGIDIPGQLRLVTHANRGVDLPYHKSVTRVEFDPVEQARRAADLMMTLLRGETPTSNYIRLPGTVVKGETT